MSWQPDKQEAKACAQSERDIIPTIPYNCLPERCALTGIGVLDSAEKNVGIFKQSRRDKTCY